MTPPSHVCPKCREPRNQESFKRKNGELAGWCSWCRDAHRARLTSLNQRKATAATIITAVAPELVAKEEGYADHPLAQLLALSHIVGAKKALGIRDGKSWKGSTAWRLYFRAKEELAALLAPKAWIDSGEGHDHGLLIPCHPMCPKHSDKKSDGVS